MTHDDLHDLGERDLWRAYPSRSRGDAGPCPDEMALAVWLDGRATSPEAERIERHLARCPACLAAVRELRDLLGAATVEFVPQEVLDAAKALAPAEAARRATVRDSAGARRARWLSAARWAAAAVAALAVAYGGFVAGGRTWRYRQSVESAAVAEASFGLAGAAGPESPDEFDELLLAGGAQ